MIAVFGAYRKPFVFEPTRFSRNILAIPLRCLAFFFQHRLLSLPRQLSASFRALVCTSLQRQTQPIQSRSVHKHKQKRKEASADKGFVTRSLLGQDELLGNLARHIFLVLTSFLGIFLLSKPKFNFLSFFFIRNCKITLRFPIVINKK